MYTTTRSYPARRFRALALASFMLFGARHSVVEGSAYGALDWIPESAKLLFYIDVGTILAHSDFLRLASILDARFDQDTLEDIRDLTGMDPWRDVSTAVYFSQIGKDGERLSGAAVTGAFDFERILGSMEARIVLKRSEHRETPVYVSIPASDRIGAHALALVNGTTILFGSTESVRLMLDVGNGLKPSCTRGPLVHYLDSTTAADAIWVVSSGELDLDERFPHTPFWSAGLPTLKSFAIAARPGSGVTVRLQGEADDSEEARELGDILQAAVSILSLANESESPISKIAQSLEFEILDERVYALASVDSRVLRKWLNGLSMELNNNR